MYEVELCMKVNYVSIKATIHKLEDKTFLRVSGISYYINETNFEQTKASNRTAVVSA